MPSIPKMEYHWETKEWCDDTCHDMDESQSLLQNESQDTREFMIPCTSKCRKSNHGEREQTAIF